MARSGEVIVGRVTEQEGIRAGRYARAARRLYRRKPSSPGRGDTFRSPRRKPWGMKQNQTRTPPAGGVAESLHLCKKVSPGPFIYHLSTIPLKFVGNN